MVIENTWLRGWESNPLFPGYEPDVIYRYPFHSPAVKLFLYYTTITQNFKDPFKKLKGRENFTTITFPD